MLQDCALSCSKNFVLPPKETTLDNFNIEACEQWAQNKQLTNLLPYNGCEEWANHAISRPQWVMKNVVLQKQILEYCSQISCAKLEESRKQEAKKEAEGEASFLADVDQYSKISKLKKQHGDDYSFLFDTEGNEKANKCDQEHKKYDQCQSWPSFGDENYLCMWPDRYNTMQDAVENHMLHCVDIESSNVRGDHMIYCNINDSNNSNNIYGKYWPMKDSTHSCQSLGKEEFGIGTFLEKGKLIKNGDFVCERGNMRVGEVCVPEVQDGYYCLYDKNYSTWSVGENALVAAAMQGHAKCVKIEPDTPIECGQNTFGPIDTEKPLFCAYSNSLPEGALPLTKDQQGNPVTACEGHKLKLGTVCVRDENLNEEAMYCTYSTIAPIQEENSLEQQNEYSGAGLVLCRPYYDFTSNEQITCNKATFGEWPTSDLEKDHACETRKVKDLIMPNVGQVLRLYDGKSSTTGESMYTYNYKYPEHTHVVHYKHDDHRHYDPSYRGEFSNTKDDFDVAHQEANLTGNKQFTNGLVDRYNTRFMS